MPARAAAALIPDRRRNALSAPPGSSITPSITITHSGRRPSYTSAALRSCPRYSSRNTCMRPPVMPVRPSARRPIPGSVPAANDAGRAHASTASGACAARSSRAVTRGASNGVAARAGISGARPRASLRSEREEIAVETVVRGELGVERGREEVALSRRDDGAVVEGRERLDIVAETRDLRRADEDRVIRLAAERLHVDVRLERVELPAKGVALDGDVHHACDRMGMARDILRDG